MTLVIASVPSDRVIPCGIGPTLDKAAHMSAAQVVDGHFHGNRVIQGKTESCLGVEGVGIGGKLQVGRELRAVVHRTHRVALQGQDFNPAHIA